MHNLICLAMIGVSEVLVIFLVLLVMVGMAAGLVFLVVWLVNRDKPARSQPSPLAAPVGLSSICPRCGAAMSTHSPQGLCPRCVMGVGLATQTETGEEQVSSGTRVVPPPEADVARRFPHLEILECLGQGGMGGGVQGAPTQTEPACGTEDPRP